MTEQTLSQPVFGLDIGSFSIKAVEVKYRGNNAELYAASIIDMPDPEKSLTEKDRQGLVTAIKKSVILSKPHRIDTKYVASALPESKVYSDIITLPQMEEEELKTAVPFEAAKHMPLALEEAYIDYSLIGTTKNDKIKLFAVAAPRDLVDFYREIISQAEMELVSLEVKPLAAARALLNEEMQKQVILIFDVGANNSSITILLDGNILVATSIFTGGELFVKAIMKELKLSRAEAIKTEDSLEKDEEKKNKVLRILFPLFDDLVAKVQKAISFHQTKSPTKKPVEKILLTGGGSNAPGLKDYIKENVGIETIMADPFINMTGEVIKSIPKPEASSIVTALGMALKR